MPSNRSSKSRGIPRLRAEKPFVIYSLGNCASLIGTWAHRLTVGWLAWDLTGSPAWLGLIVFADLFPTIVATPFASVMADRTNRLRVLRWCPLLAMLQALTLAALVAAGSLTILTLLLLTMVLGTIDAVSNPYRLTMIHALVPSDLLAPAVAFNSIIFNTARFLGPALAGALIVTVGPAFCFVVIAGGFAIFLTALMSLKIPSEPAAPFGEGIVGQFRQGLAYIWADGVIPTLLVVVVVTGILVRPVVDLLPGIAATNFSAGPVGLSALTASVAAGALMGGIWLGWRGQTDRLARIAGLCALMMGVAGFMSTFVSSLALAFPIYAVLGFFGATLLIVVQTAVQLRCAPDMRGRVLGTYGMLFRLAPALGAAVMGTMSELFGFRIPLALACFSVVVCSACLWKRLGKMA